MAQKSVWVKGCDLHALAAGQTYPDIPIRVLTSLGVDGDLPIYVLCHDKSHVFTLNCTVFYATEGHCAKLSCEKNESDRH